MRASLVLAFALLAAGCASVEEGRVPLLEPKSIEPAPGEEVVRAAFESDSDLVRWKRHAGSWAVAKGAAVGTQVGADYAYLTWPVYYGSLSSVTIRGGIRSASNRNFRVAVGHVSAIFNWENGDVNVFRNGSEAAETHPAALAPGAEHEIRFLQDGELVRVLVDGRELWQCRTALRGTVTVYPAVGSTIRVRDVVIRGVPIPWIEVRGPSQPAP